jgi:hypothetical protein
MANIPPDTPMSPALFALMEFFDLTMIDGIWPATAADCVTPVIQARAYTVMSSLYVGNGALPTEIAHRPREEMKTHFAWMWCGVPPQNGEEQIQLKTKRDVMAAIGWLHYDIIRAGLNGGTQPPPYEVALQTWSANNAGALADADKRFRSWLQNHP